MEERKLRELIEDVRHGRVSRRGFVQTMVGLGLTAPLAAQMLASAGVARAQAKNPVFTPTKRGGGGPLRILCGRRLRFSIPTSPPAPRTRMPRAFSTSRFAP